LITVVLYIVLAMITVFCAIALYNAVTAPMITNRPPKTTSADDIANTDPLLLPRVSVLIPARNEEHNIARCLEGLVHQTYKHLEIIVLNDHSTDGTARVVQEYALKYQGLVKLMNGITIPQGWTGKNWACQQLSSAATGDVLIFTDADNTHAATAVAKTVQWLKTYKLGLISAFPQQQTVSFAEQLVVPIMDMFVYAGLPLWLTYNAEHPSLAAANGQWIAFNKDAYTFIGGHFAVKDRIVEDVELARTIKQRGIDMITAAGTSEIFCRMYTSFDEVWHGFTKNIFGLVRYNGNAFFALMLMLFALCILPYFLVFVEEYRTLCLATIVLNLLMRGILAWRFKHPLVPSILLHPVGVGLMIAIGVNSYKEVSRGTIRWKDREIAVHLEQ